jgi:hypothetical protein
MDRAMTDRTEYNRAQKSAARARAKEAAMVDRIADKIVSACADKIASAVVRDLSAALDLADNPKGIVRGQKLSAATPPLSPLGGERGEGLAGNADTEPRGLADTNGADADAAARAAHPSSGAESWKIEPPDPETIERGQARIREIRDQLHGIRRGE